ncbi:hypothetical protein ACFTWF_34785 [Rhodococcus sp. NPDC056960]|uniref:hypothetical protein n=1 Tax=Rhodococcus sp. NPDC056960 TaxID=3345982 RepID=UPI0036260C05
MALQANGYQIIGVSLRGSGPISEILHLELDDGLSVLYGLNGAGKSHVLRALTDCLLGIKGGDYAGIHIQLDDAPPNSYAIFPQQIDQVLNAAIKHERGDMFSSYSFDEHEILDSEYRESSDDELSIDEKLFKLIELRASHHGFSSETKQALNDLIQYRRFTLHPDGDGTWSLWLAAGISDSMLASNLLATVPDSLDTFYREVFAGEPDSGPYTHPLVPMLIAMNYATHFPTTGTGEPPQTHSEWPNWLQVPVFSIGKGITLRPTTAIDTAIDTSQLNVDTLVAITGVTSRPSNKRNPMITATPMVTATSGDTLGLVSEIETRKLQIESDCNYYISLMLISPPTIRFNLRTADELLLGDRPRWEFSVSSSPDRWLSIEKLSTAQLRWAQYSIRLAIAHRDEAPVVFLCDEPELGLHRLAERRVAAGLVELAQKGQMSVLAATHSSFVLDNAKATKILTYRDKNGAGATRVRPLTYSLLDDLDIDLSVVQLGLQFSDLIQLMNVAVVVEGLHDEVVLKNLLRPHLDKASAGIFAMRGAKNAKSLVEAKLLFMATNARVLVVLDNLDNQIISGHWKAICDAADEGDLDEARRKVGGLLSLKGVDEARYLAELATAALETGNISRVEIFGLSQPDIVCYLPEADLLTDSTQSWEMLIRRWKNDAPMTGPSNIKKYLNKIGCLPLPNSEELNSAITSAALSAAETPANLNPELIRLGERIVSLATHAR